MFKVLGSKHISAGAIANFGVAGSLSAIGVSVAVYLALFFGATMIQTGSVLSTSRLSRCWIDANCMHWLRIQAA